MNAYQKRMQERNLRRLERTQEAHGVHLHEIALRIRRHERAYLDAHGQDINVTYHKGWYWVRNRRYRASALDKLSELLEAQVHAKESPAVED